MFFGSKVVEPFPAGVGATRLGIRKVVPWELAAGRAFAGLSRQAAAHEIGRTQT